MKIFKAALMASVVAAGMGPFSAAPVSAFPLGPAAAAVAAQLNNSAPAVQVRYYRGWGVGPGIIGGLVLGEIIASQRPYYYGYPGYPGYYGYPAPVYATPYGGSVGYCMSRFKSYDPSSGTYLGFDGRRHPCP